MEDTDAGASEAVGGGEAAEAEAEQSRKAAATTGGSDDVDEADVALRVRFDDDETTAAGAGPLEPGASDADAGEAEVGDADASEPGEGDAGPPPAGEVRRFLDRRRPWRRAESRRDRQRRFSGLYWSGVYVLLMAGATSMVSFLVVRGYLWIAPGPTTTGAGVARRVVPWVLTVVFLAFAWFVTRSWRRLLVLAVLFLAPTLAFTFLDQAQALAEWVVSWIPGTTTVYGLTAFGPVVAVVLLGIDFVKWQLWVEFPQSSCWGCGARVRDERWIVCPYCDNDLEAQRGSASEPAPGAAGAQEGEDTAAEVEAAATGEAS